MKKQVKLAAYAVAVVLMFGVVGCGGNSADSVAEEYVEFLEDADFGGMRKVATGGMIQWLDRAERKYEEVAKLLGEKTAEKHKDTYDDLKIEIGEANVNEDKVVLPVKINTHALAKEILSRASEMSIKRRRQEILSLMVNRP